MQIKNRKFRPGQSPPVLLFPHRAIRIKGPPGGTDAGIWQRRPVTRMPRDATLGAAGFGIYRPCCPLTRMPRDASPPIRGHHPSLFRRARDVTAGETGRIAGEFFFSGIPLAELRIRGWTRLRKRRRGSARPGFTSRGKDNYALTGTEKVNKQ